MGVYTIECKAHFVVLGAQLSSCILSLHLSIHNFELLLRHDVQVEVKFDDIVAELFDFAFKL